MKIQFDDCTDLNSWVHQWDARFKVIGLVGLMMAFAAVKSLWLLPWMLLIVGGLYRLSGLPLSFLQTRLRYPGLFLVGLVLFIPWLSGETPLWQWGPLTLWQEGVLLSLLITGRFLCSVTLGFIVLGTTPFLNLVNALRTLGVPALMTDMMVLSYRYLFEILANLDRMQRAMTLRGFRATPSPQRFSGRSPHFSTDQSFRLTIFGRSLTNQITILATLAGTLFIRSYEQAERVYQAMRLRGYGYRPQRLTPRRDSHSPTGFSGVSAVYRSVSGWVSTYGWDAIALLFSVLIAGSLIAANHWLSQDGKLLNI